MSIPDQFSETPSDEDDVGAQDEPIMEQNVASDRAKLEGIVLQTISDLGRQHPIADIEAVVRSRSAESGLEYSGADISTAVREAIERGSTENRFDSA